jgi:transcriptional regulator with XRE-family HTH domain
MKTLPNRIRQIRENCKLTQSEVASKMNISSSTYGKIERNANHSSYETLTKVANAIGVTIQFLFDLDNKNNAE